MNRKRNIAYTKPEDPHFLKVLKKQAGYDDSNHKFDKLENSEEDFAEDEDSELPQVVVLKKGDLTAEEAELEKQRIKKEESETKADLTQKVVFKSKKKSSGDNKKDSKKMPLKSNNSKQKLLSFSADNLDDDDDDDAQL